MVETNKFGLSRNIPSDVKREVRQKCGFGCVICHHAIIQYHHLSPGYANVRIHDPNEIVLLCPTHHQQADKRLSDSYIRKCMRLKNSDFAWDKMNISNDCRLIVAGSVFENTSIVLIDYGRPIIWIERVAPHLPPLISAIITNDKKETVMHIHQNEIIYQSVLYDVEGRGEKTIIRRKRGEILVEFSINEKEVNFTRLHMTLLGCKVDAHHKSGIKVSTISVDEMSISGATFSDIAAINIGHRLRAAPSEKRRTQMINYVPIYGFCGQRMGFLADDDFIHDRCGNTVAVKKDGDCVYDIWPNCKEDKWVARQFIGNLVSYKEGFLILYFPNKNDDKFSYFNSDRQFSFDSKIAIDQMRFLNEDFPKNSVIGLDQGFYIPLVDFDFESHTGSFLESKPSTGKLV